ncbi:Nucleic-acid-binding protein [Aphis craccivora]|uniref:Nucleic-acid-binding protein n=1 Tax=Aphis craccivora TaxID=307492 RepID=A0A6G0Z2G1_APHCR|nr:Nucleic-acid-binding protein [Aphis craccivora]
MIPRNQIALITNLIASNSDKNTFQISTQKDYNLPDKFSFCDGANSWSYKEYLVYKKLSATVKKKIRNVSHSISRSLNLTQSQNPRNFNHKPTNADIVSNNRLPITG